jgi:hypothetical protein
MDTSGREAKFAETIHKAWERACQTYLKESRLDEDSEDWKLILNTKDPQQVIDIINEAWAKRKSKDRTSSQQVVDVIDETPESKDDPSPSTPKSKKPAVKRILNRLVRRSESAFRKSAEVANTSQSYIEKRSDLKPRLSGNAPKGKGVIDDGAELTDAALAISQSDTLKTIVDGVEKFSGALQHLVSISQVVRSLFLLFLNSSGPHMYQSHWVVFGCSSR